jgi:outer membrane lipoprotein SlyB
MDTTEIRHKAAAHPIMIIAAVAVILFSSVGIAAIMGWLPSSSANGAANTSAAALAPAVATTPAALPSGASNSSYSDSRGAVNGQYPAQGNTPAYTQPAAASCDNCGVIQGVREVHHRGSGTGVGAAGGAILGGLLGNAVGGGHGRQLATVAGAVGGAVAGNQVEGNMRSSTSYEIVVHMNSGATRTFHQSALPNWREGDHVRVVNGHLQAD